MRSFVSLVVPLLTFSLSAIVPDTRARSLAITTLHQFGAVADGNDPRSPLTRGTDGSFYGTTVKGGVSGLGTIFKFTPGGQYTIIHSFTAEENISPATGPAIVQASDGSLYGASGELVYRLAPDGTVSTLSTIGGDDYITTSLLLGQDGNLYGTRKNIYFDELRSIYKLTPNGTFSILQKLNRLNPGLVEGTDGSIYGVTAGEEYRADATVFKISPGGTFTTIYTFANYLIDFRYFYPPGPNSGLVLGKDGNLYGTVPSDYGTVFRLTPGGEYSVVHEFDYDHLNQDGAHLTAGLSDGGDGFFYGATTDGGAQNAGTIFRVAIDGSFAVLRPLTAAEKDVFTFPLLADDAGGLYGVRPKPDGYSDAAGTYHPLDDQGEVFRFTPSDGQLSITHAFIVNEVTKPNNRLVQGSDGKFYGTGSGGGANGAGGIYSVTAEGAATTLYSFRYQQYRNAPLVEGRDGNFYGVDGGSVFKITPTGTFSAFSGFQEGSQIVGGIVLGSDGNFYGTSRNSGSVNTVFVITPDGTMNRLHTFTAAEGGTPTSGLVQGPDGNFYGTTSATVYKVTLAGALTTLTTFKISDAYGAAGVVLGPEGKLYGIYSHEEGDDDNRTLYSLTTDGVFTSLRTADEDSTTLNFSDLIADKDGALYGIAADGGANRKGSLFKLAADGTQTTLYSFDGSVGSNPNFLVQGSDGSFYGTTAEGGVADNGLFYKAVIPPVPPTPTVTPTLSVSRVTVGSGQNAIITLKLPAARADNVTIYYTVKGTAVPGVDYIALNGHAKIKAGKTSKPIRIVPLGDLGGAAKKTVKITFTPDDSYGLSDSKPIKVKLFSGH